MRAMVELQSKEGSLSQEEANEQRKGGSLAMVKTLRKDIDHTERARRGKRTGSALMQ